MLKNNRQKLIISSILILLPILFGLLFWNDLPDHMTTHWGVDGNPDGWAGKAFAVFVLPVLMLGLHWFALWITAKDPGNRSQSSKVFGLLFWIVPFISLFANGVIYAASFGVDFQLFSFVPLLLGLMFLLIGNYLPKCRQNTTIGIKVKWALENEENWNATHRLSGKLWVAGGLLMMACVFLPDSALSYAMPAVILVTCIIPVVYSWLYHQKQVREGTAVITPFLCSKSQKIVACVSLAIVAAALSFAAVLLFTGEISVVFGEESFTIEASYWPDLTVAYETIDAIEYHDQDDPGIRISGLGGAKLLAGSFRNDEFGSYTRYTHTGCDACIVLKADGKILVLNGPDVETTKALCEAIQSHIQ